MTTSFLSQIAPSATNQIRFDHMHVLGFFHQYELASSHRTKKGLADSICLALEIHAQLEEEIFYPVMRLLLMDNDVMKNSPQEHDEMRAMITRLRQMPADDPTFDDTFFSLMRDVMHHVADEESVVLPAAEKHIPEQLADLGAQMARRRMELTTSRGGELASGLFRSFSAGTVLATAGALFTSGSMLSRHAGVGRNGMRGRMPGFGIL